MCQNYAAVAARSFPFRYIKIVRRAKILFYRRRYNETRNWKFEYFEFSIYVLIRHRGMCRSMAPARQRQNATRRAEVSTPSDRGLGVIAASKLSIVVRPLYRRI